MKIAELAPRLDALRQALDQALRGEEAHEGGFAIYHPVSPIERNKVRTKPCLTLEDCRKITDAAIAEAKKNKWNVTICITDDGGHTLLLTRMDGCAPVTAEIATLKSQGAAIARRPTKVAEDRIAAGRVALLRMPPLPVQGGVPILVQGECVGAVGVSGVQSHEDEQVCNAGIAALQ